MLAPARDSDLAAAAALINAAYRGNGPGWTSEADFLEGLRTDEADLRAELARRPGATLYLLREGDALNGCVLLQPNPAGAWYLGMLAVQPNRQDRQLGRAILSEAEDLARAYGAERVRMTVVNIREELIAWYRRRGYELTGETQPFPYDSPFGRSRRDDLHFVMLEKRL